MEGAPGCGGASVSVRFLSGASKSPHNGPKQKKGGKKGDHTSGRHNPATSTGTPPSPWSRTHNDILTASTTILGHDLLENPRKVQGEGGSDREMARGGGGRMNAHTHSDARTDTHVRTFSNTLGLSHRANEHLPWTRRSSPHSYRGKKMLLQKMTNFPLLSLLIPCLPLLQTSGERGRGG